MEKKDFIDLGNCVYCNSGEWLCSTPNCTILRPSVKAEPLQRPFLLLCLVHLQRVRS